MAAGHLRAGDARLVLEVIEDAWADDPGEDLPWALFEGLHRLVPCDETHYEDHFPARHEVRLTQALDCGGESWVQRCTMPFDEPFFQEWPGSVCAWPQRSGDLRTVFHTGDFLPTERARRSDRMLQALPGLRHCMVVSLPAPPGEVRRVLFLRGSGPPFTERDRQVAALLRPHLQEIWLDAARRRRGIPRLSTREWEVLERAAAGASYADIAAELFISLGTVRKHMEHVRERLGVHSVLAAAAVALPRPPATTGSRPGRTRG